jgi:predicted metal-dependent phosphoesterase TrpH
MIDLHSHTTASDGSFSPREVVQMAHGNDLKAVGITDHDTIAGWDEAFGAGAELGVEIVPGIELSTSYEGGRFHLLGYYLAPQSALMEQVREIQAARANRNVQIFANLIALGLPLTEEEVYALVGENGQLGRPHFARAMVARGYVSSTQEAFDLYLADGKPAYATKEVLTPQEAIAGIHEAGGVAIWAHPVFARKFSWEEMEAKLQDWIGWGLDGWEVLYGKYAPEDMEWTEAMAAKYNLLRGGGSDFHGASKPDIELGKTSGGAVPDEFLTAIKARRDQRRNK